MWLGFVVGYIVGGIINAGLWIYIALWRSTK